MSDKPITIIISDLHVGGGPADPGDDHVYQKSELSRFLDLIPEAREGKVELFINGDFLEFAQVKPEVEETSGLTRGFDNYRAGRVTNLSGGRKICRRSRPRTKVLDLKGF